MVASSRLLSTLPSFPSLPWKNSSQRGAAVRKMAARRPVCPGTGAPPAGRGRGERLQQAYGTPTKLIRGQTRRQWPGRAGRKGRARGRKMQRAKKKPQGSWAGRRKHTWSAGVWCRVPRYDRWRPPQAPPPSGKATWAVGGLPEVPCPGASVEGRACRAPGQPTYGGLGADEGGTGAAVAPPLPTGQDGRGGGAALNKFPNRNSFPPLGLVPVPMRAAKRGRSTNGAR